MITKLSRVVSVTATNTSIHWPATIVDRPGLKPDSSNNFLSLLSLCIKRLSSMCDNRDNNAGKYRVKYRKRAEVMNNQNGDIELTVEREFVPKKLCYTRYSNRVQKQTMHELSLNPLNISIYFESPAPFCIMCIWVH